MSTLRNSKVTLKKGFKIARLNIKMKLISYLHWVLILMIIKIICLVF
ncbi:TPA: shiE [Escherichia coli]|nr:shiE [Escherichia coli]EFA5288430.1 shiE [Escherichia coli]EFN8111391.1 shiE [Escherichia coli]HAI2298730.1 shiE [Escherichia coli]